MITVEEKIKELLDLLKDIGLDYNWLIAVVSLSAQEVAIKKKLDELGEPYEEEDFQKIADKLLNIMKKRKIEVPNILLSIARSYRHIRAKLLHDPHRTMLSITEAEAVFNNTKALIKTLFKKELKELSIPKFIDLLITLSSDHSLLNQQVIEFSNFNETTKKQIFESIMNRIVLLKQTEVATHEGLFVFLKAALQRETNITLQGELFKIILYRTSVIPSHATEIKEKLLSIIAELTKLSHIEQLVRNERNLINIILAEYEASNSFTVAGWNAEIIANLASILNDEEIERVVHAILSNDQITYSWKARPFLRKIFSLHRNRIPKEEIRKLEEILEE